MSPVNFASESGAVFTSADTSAPDATYPSVSMNLRVFFFALVSAFSCVVFPDTGHAQLSALGGKSKHLTAELISEMSTVAPGKTFRVLVKLEVEKDWHTYGKTLPEGVTGKPTRLIWTLPEGWKVEDLPWPATQRRDFAGRQGARL